MVARINLIPNPPKALTVTAINVTGLTPATGYALHIYQGPYASEIRMPFVTDGSGAAQLSLVPALPGGGAFTIEVLQTTVTSVVSMQFSTVGSG